MDEDVKEESDDAEGNEDENADDVDKRMTARMTTLRRTMVYCKDVLCVLFCTMLYQ